jgi:hypothetical protein
MPEPLELVFIDPKSPPRLRKKAAWQRLLEEARAEPACAPDPDPGDPVLPGQRLPTEDRADVFLILARAAPVDEAGAAAAFAEGLREDGKLAPSLVAVAGEIRFRFDELEALKAMVTTATPFLGGDEPLKAAVDAAKEFLTTSGRHGTPAVIETLTARVREAFGRAKRAVPAGYLEAQTDRALLEQRRYKERMFAGDPHLRTLVQPPAGAALLAYVPASAKQLLPLFQRFPARLVAEVLPGADQYETHSFALRVLALARVVAPPGAKR